jgi:hypothetical protein
MTHIRPRTALRRPCAAPPTTPICEDPSFLRETLASNRAAVARLEADWVATAEADLRRSVGGRIRVDNRETWDKATWDRYLTAAAAHEDEFKPRIMRLLRDIDGLEAQLSAPLAARAA